MRAGYIAAGVVVVLIVAGAALAPATDWLVAGEPPVPADLLVVLSGGSWERFSTAIDLYRAGMAPAILITDPFGFADAEMRRLEAQGVPASALIAPLRPAGSTYEDSLAVRQLILKKGLKSILVVTSPYHCRRVRLIFRRVVEPLGVRVTVTPSTTLYMDMAHWWRGRQGWITVPGEFPKLLWAWATVPTVPTVGHSGAAK